MSTSRQNLRIQKWVAGISVLLLVVKFAAYFYTSSVAVLTDALESIVNVVAGFIGLYSLYIASLPKDAKHPYGHGKAEFLSAAIEGTLIAIAGIVIIYKAVVQLIHPVEIKKIDLGIILIALTAIINYGLGTYCVLKGKQNNSIALLTSGKHLQTDTYSTVGVVLGLVLIYFSRSLWIDSIVAIILALFILYTAYTILRASVAGIMDEADQKLLTQMIAMLNDNRQENWVDLHNLRVIKYGSVLHVDCHLTVPRYLNVDEAHIEIDGLSKAIEKRCGEGIELFVHTDGCLDFQCPVCEKNNCPVRAFPFEKRIEWSIQNVVSNLKHNSPESSLTL